MNILMSLWTKPCTNGKAHGYSTVENMVNSIILSSNVIKKKYDNIIFYTDKLGYEWIEPFLDQLPFSKIEVVMDEINWLDDNYWSLGKMYVYSLQKEPFLHIDNDVFIWEKFTDEMLSKDFLFQEIEKFGDKLFNFYDKGLKIYGLAIPKEIEVLNAAFNCGIFGCLTQEGLKIIQDYYDIGYKFVKKTKVIPNIDKEAISERALASVIIEQVFIYSLVVKNNLTYSLLSDDNYKYKIKYTHQIASSKRNPIVEQKIRERIYFKHFEL